MRAKGLLAAFLLAVGLCFAPGVGHGEVTMGYGEDKPLDEPLGLPLIEWRLMQQTGIYMMENPTSFLRVWIHYDEDGSWGRFGSLPDGLSIPDWLPKHVDTKGKICLSIGDNIFRGDNKRVFYDKSGGDLLDEFKRQLELIYSFIESYATDMNADIVATFYTREKKPSLPTILGYFYQGEYYLWEK